ncbi:unnamed protein product [Lampetra fluviatilis]
MSAAVPALPAAGTRAGDATARHDGNVEAERDLDAPDTAASSCSLADTICRDDDDGGGDLDAVSDEVMREAEAEDVDEEEMMEDDEEDGGGGDEEEEEMEEEESAVPPGANPGRAWERRLETSAERNMAGQGSTTSNLRAAAFVGDCERSAALLPTALATPCGPQGPSWPSRDGRRRRHGPGPLKMAPTPSGVHITGGATKWSAAPGRGWAQVGLRGPCTGREASQPRRGAAAVSVVASPRWWWCPRGGGVPAVVVVVSPRRWWWRPRGGGGVPAVASTSEREAAGVTNSESRALPARNITGRGRGTDMELAACERLSQLLEELTTAGGERLDPAGMKELKKICKQSDAYVQHAYQLLLTQLRQEHSEVRLAALLVADELFSRSHAFRLALLSDLQLVLELTAETDPERPLPPPSAAAHRLRGLALRTVHAWHERYGQDYRKLALGYHFLKHARKVDFQDVQARSLAQRQREAEQQRRQDTLNKEKARKAAAEMEETVGELQDCLTQAESCFQLLLPSLGEFDVFTSDAGSAGGGKGWSGVALVLRAPCALWSVSDPDEDDEDEDDDDDDEDSGEGGEAAGGGSGKEEQGHTFMRDHGLISHSYSLTLEIPPVVVVQEDEDNSAVLTTLRDQLGLIQTRHLPRVQAWLQAFTRAGMNDASLKRAIDIKMALEATVKKHEEMNIHYRASRAQHSPIEESDSEFEEVPEKDGYEPHIPEHRRAEYGECGDPYNHTTSSSHDAEGTNCDEITEDNKIEWHCGDGEWRVALLMLLPCWARSPGLEPESPQEARPGPSRGLAPGGPGTSRAAAPRTCRAPLPDGRLCERADRHKCPFHGKIVPRDEQGVPASAEDVARLERERRQREEAERPGWRDAELMRDIEAATGLELGSSRPERGKGKGKGKGKKYPNLTDVKQLNNTARSRLERKVFNRASVKRVSAAMSKLDRGKHERFTNQFTYALT